MPARFRTDAWLTAALVVSSAAILCFGAYGVLKTVAAVADPRVSDAAVDVAAPDTARSRSQVPSADQRRWRS
ncbi:hypothetical protein [Streptomyces sp. E5N91]|uniref:hypothetical protein n=1 Tax=Streptomyces sp. E5N91 TaxID=1851996 RepID=UPI001EE86F87|nr:hypothetical protein [Streptomyces sp. E5N91]